MDIQKEKKAIKNLKAFYMEDWNLTEEERDDLDNLVSRIVAVIKAEAQAVPEGFVLVPMVPSERMINAVRHCYEGEAYLPYSLYSEFVNQAIIERMEAQEPAND